MGVSTILLLLFRRFARSLARENALQVVRYRCIAKIISAAVFPDADDDEKDNDGVVVWDTVRQHLRQRETIVFLRTFI